MAYFILALFNFKLFFPLFMLTICFFFSGLTSVSRLFKELGFNYIDNEKIFK